MSKNNNIIDSSFPYGWAFQDSDMPLTRNSTAKKVIFFGNDMATFTNMGVDANSYINKCNECLDYIRREFSGHDLIYKPHPADKDERAALNLQDFKLVEDDTNAELFLFNNHNEVRAVFSLGSAACYSAYAMAFNSYVFYKLFNNILSDELVRPLDEFYHDMPESFFVRSFSNDVSDNARVLKNDDGLKLLFNEILDKNSGKIWLVAFTVEYVVLLIALATMIKNVDPNRSIGLIVSKHRYWDSLNSNFFKKYFDNVLVWPRINYSLRPTKLLQAVRLAYKIRKFKISQEDIIISIAQNSFVENCLNSYNKKNTRIGLISGKYLNLFYNNQNSIYQNNNNFRFSKASWFYNRIFEPILGLNRTTFMFYGLGGGSFITRYQKPLNEIFDKVVVLKAGE